MNHVCIKHIITDDKDNFNRYWHVKSIKHAEFSFRTEWSLHWKKLIFLHAFLNLNAEGNNFAGKEFPILLMVEVNSQIYSEYSERKQIYCCLGQLGASSKSSVAASTLLPSSVAEFLKASSSSPIDELLIRNLIKGIIVVQNLQRWLFWPRLKVNIFHWHLSKWVHEIVFVE